jgi:predicted ATPase with chaperone activity
VRGILPATLAARQAGFTRVIVPVRQAGEAGLVEGIEVFGVASITQLMARPAELVVRSFDGLTGPPRHPDT